MLKQVWIAKCDLCGRVEQAKAVFGQYNETNYTIPEGWDTGHNKDFILCPECLSAIKGRTP